MDGRSASGGVHRSQRRGACARRSRLERQSSFEEAGTLPDYRITWLTVLACAWLLAGCAAAQEEPGGGALTFVSLNPCTDAILAQVADPGQIIAISHYSHDPRATSMPLALARRWRAVGGTAEEVLALDPDVVVATPFLPSATVWAFRRLGLRVETIGIAATVAESHAQVRRLAALAGHPARGEALVRRIESALAAARHEGPQVTALLWQSGGIVPGEDTLAAALLRQAGFASHSAARGLGQGAYLPLEQVLADPPELVIAAGSDRMLAHPALRRLAGVRYERLEPNLLFCGGPSIVPALGRLAEIRSKS